MFLCDLCDGGGGIVIPKELFLFKKDRKKPSCDYDYC